MNTIFDRAGYAYQLLKNSEKATSFVTFKTDGTPLVVRNGVEVKQSLFTDGNGRWARLIDSTKPSKVEKTLSNPKNPAIAFKDNAIVCQFVPMVNILWHDSTGKKFYLIGKDEEAELKADGLAYVTAKSDDETYETLKFYCFDGEMYTKVPQALYNERNLRFVLCNNMKRKAYQQVQLTGSAIEAAKPGIQLYYAEQATGDESVTANTNGAYEAAEKAEEGSWIVSKVDSDNGSWPVPNKEFQKKYREYGVDNLGRKLFVAEGTSIWTQVNGNYIFCIPQWGDSMVAMANPQINITNPDDVYACAYIVFYGNEHEEGLYIVLGEIFFGAPKKFVEQFFEAMVGYVTGVLNVPKSAVNQENLQSFLNKTLGIPENIMEAVVKQAA